MAVQEWLPWHDGTSCRDALMEEMRCKLSSAELERRRTGFKEKSYVSHYLNYLNSHNYITGPIAYNYHVCHLGYKH